VRRFRVTVRRISSHSEAVFRLSEAEKRLSVAVSRHTVAVLRHSVMTLTWSVTLGWYLRPSYSIIQYTPTNTYTAERRELQYKTV